MADLLWLSASVSAVLPSSESINKTKPDPKDYLKKFYEDKNKYKDIFDKAKDILKKHSKGQPEKK